METEPVPRVLLGHGGGGQLTHDLIREVFLDELANPILAELGDAGRLALPEGGSRLAMTTDSFVVQPLFFPGGDIGSLAIHGTVNDLAVSGARPAYLTLAAILEEGLPLSDLRRAVASAAAAARAVGVLVVSGDTKVVERGKGDGIFFNTAGVGLMREGYPRADRPVREGDAIIVSGPVGDHGAVILSARASIDPGPDLASDAGPVVRVADALFEGGRLPLFMRDPTRGGLAGVLCDIAETREGALGVHVEEAELPVREAVATVCDITGVDPIYLACEGRVVAVVPEEEASAALAAWRNLPEGREAARIGTVVTAHPGRVVVGTRFGGARRLLRPASDLLPRIC